MKSLLLEHKKKFILYVIACFFPVVVQLMQIGVVALIFETVERADLEFFKFALILAIMFLIISQSTFILSRMMRISYMRDVLLSLRIRAFDKIMAMSYKQYSQNSREVYVSHLINDINTFENTFFLSLINFIFRLGLYVTIIIILFFLNPIIAIIVLVASVLVLFISRLYEKKTVKLQKEVSTENENYTLNMANTFNGLDLLKLNNIERAFLLKNEQKIERLEDKKMQFNVFTAFQLYSNVAIGYFLFMGMLVYLMYQTKDGLGFGELVLTIQLSSSAIFPLVNLMPLINTLKSSKAIYEKITAKETYEEVNGKTEPFDFQKAITLSHVNFAYDQDHVILKDVNLRLEKGKNYLVKGPSGSGKSTLIKILSQIIEDYEGTICLDDKDLRTIKTQAFNDKIAYVYQDVFLFEASLKDNITLFKEASDEAVLDACHKAGLDDVIQGLEGGIHARLEENGKNLSGGQRQRLSIARALFKQAEILFADEATSALNDDLGRTLEATLLSQDLTLVAISHKNYAENMHLYDAIIEIKDGYVQTYPSHVYLNGGQHHEA